MINEQPLTRREWKEIVEELRILIHNNEVNLELLRAQLKEAMTHSRGQSP